MKAVRSCVKNIESIIINKLRFAINLTMFMFLKNFIDHVADKAISINLEIKLPAINSLCSDKFPLRDQLNGPAGL